MAITPATLSFTDDGTPYAPVYDDVYHSRAGAIAQARHVFLGGNDLPARWANRDHFVIVETGFGLGLNFLTTWAIWQTQPQSHRCQRLHFISIEKHPLLKHDLQRLLAPYQGELPPESIRALVEQWPILSCGMHRLEFENGHVVLTLILGNAETHLQGLSARADAIFLDGFSPAKNPDIWSDDVCHSLARLSGAETTLATWSVSGTVRRRLFEHGFDVSVAPGFAEKREMLRGRFRQRRPHPNPGLSAGHALIIGAGLAGTATAERLSVRGWHCTILEAHTLASGASGNTAGIIRPLPSIDDNVLARLTRAGFSSTLQRLRQLATLNLPVAWQNCGVLHLARDASQAETMQRTVLANRFPEALLEWRDQVSASDLAKIPLSNGGWWFPTGGWVNPSNYCRQLLAKAEARLLERTKVHAIRPAMNGWRAEDSEGHVIAQGDILVLANAAEAPALASPFSEALPIRPARGQTTRFAAPPGPAPETVVCRNGYWTPSIEGMTTCGASFIVDDLCSDLRNAEHAENMALVSEMVATGYREAMFLPSATDPALAGKVGWRPVVPDRLPLVGQVPTRQEFNPARQSRAARERVPGLYINSGYGARGILLATLCAEVIACQISGEPLPLEKDLVRAIDPMRYAHKKHTGGEPE